MFCIPAVLCNKISYRNCKAEFAALSAYSISGNKDCYTNLHRFEDVLNNEPAKKPNFPTPYSVSGMRLFSGH